MAHRNIPVFVPHMGCPHQCVFCNQHSISGCDVFSPKKAEEVIIKALSTLHGNNTVEIAFFGGSFTGIERGLMLSLLNMAQRYVDGGNVESIRLSTRPDYIDGEIVEILSRYSIKTVELGLQSFSQRVLDASQRGHTTQQSREAVRALRSAGFSVVGQMMIGLPASCIEDERETAREIISLGIREVRIYPTVVFYNTPLAELCQKEKYIPLSLEEAVQRSSEVLRIFEEEGVSCIRIGLQATESLTDPAYVMAGPNHPALGELVWNAYYYTQLEQAIRADGLEGKAVELILPGDMVSKVVGQKRQNIKRLEAETGVAVRKIIQDNTVRQPMLLPYRT